MIKTLNKGGIGTLLIGICLVALTKYIPITKGLALSQINWPELVLFGVLLIIQGIWFQRLIHNARFFEFTSVVPFILYLVVTLSLPSQLNRFIPLMVNFVFLIFYQKLFYPRDRDQVDRQIFIEAGLLTGIFIILDPKLIITVPFILIMLNQFVASSFNRTLLVFLSTLVLLISYLSIIFFVYGMERIDGFLNDITYHIDYESVTAPGNLYPYLIYVLSAFLIAIPVYRQLAYMQNMKRYIINILYLQILFFGLVAIFAGESFHLSLQYLTLPIAFILSFGLQHMKSRWLQNVVVLFFLFALIFTQIVYQLP